MHSPSSWMKMAGIDTQDELGRTMKPLQSWARTAAKLLQI